MQNERFVGRLRLPVWGINVMHGGRADGPALGRSRTSNSVEPIKIRKPSIRSVWRWDNGPLISVPSLDQCLVEKVGPPVPAIADVVANRPALRFRCAAYTV